MSRKCIACLLIMTCWLTVGCSPTGKFKTESIQFGPGRELIIKGWTKGERFCLELKLESSRDDLALHSVNLVNPAGEKQAPCQWEDKTPTKATPSVSFGVGVGMGSERREYSSGSDCPESSGSTRTHSSSTTRTKTMVMPGFSFPLKGKDGKTGMMALEACWEISATEQTADVTKCTLEVNLTAVSQERIEVTTVPLALAHHEEEPEEPEQDTSQEDLSKLVKEIDFTLKSPPTTRTIET